MIGGRQPECLFLWSLLVCLFPLARIGTAGWRGPQNPKASVAVTKTPFTAMDAPRNSRHSDVLVLPGASTVLVLQPPTGCLHFGDTVAPLSARAGDESVAVPLNPISGFSATVHNLNISSSSNLQQPRDQTSHPRCSEVAVRLSAGSFRHFTCFLILHITARPVFVFLLRIQR